MATLDLSRLELQVDALLNTIDQLREENQNLQEHM